MTTPTLRISRQQLAKFLGNDHDAIRQFETLFNAVANPDPTSTATEPEILVEAAAHEALARIERLERALGLLELAPSNDITRLQTELNDLKPIVIDKIRVYLATATNSSTVGWQKVPMDTVVFDTNSIWDSTNKRVTPKKSGYYQINMRVRRNLPAGMVAGVALNGSSVAVTYVGADAGSVYASGGSALVYCNGTTDYIEAYVWSVTSYAYTNVDRETWFEALGPF